MSHNMKAHKSLVNSQLLHSYKLMGGYSISNAFSCPKSNVFRFKEEHPKCIKSKAQRNPREREKPFFIFFSVFGHTLLLRWLYALADILQLSEMYMMFFSGIRKREKMS